MGLAEDIASAKEILKEEGGNLHAPSNQDILLNLIEKISEQQADIKVPYKSYAAIVNQSGTNNPVAQVLRDEIKENYVWSRFVQGFYGIISPFDGLYTIHQGNSLTIDAFPTQTTGSSLTNFSTFIDPGFASLIAYRLLSSGVEGEPTTAVAVDGTMFDQYIEIRKWD